MSNGTAVSTPPKEARRKTSRGREESIKDDTKIVVDAESILDMLMSEQFDNLGEESDDEGLTMQMRREKSPVNKTSVESETTPTKRSTVESKTSPTRRSGVSEVLSRRNKMQSPTNSSTATAEEKPRTRSPLLQTVNKVESNRNLKTETQSRISERNLKNTEDEEEPFRMRGRSNAIDVKDSPSLRSKAQRISQQARTDSLATTTSARAKPETQSKAEREDEERPLAKSPVPPAEETASQRDRKKDLRRSTSIQAEEVGLPRSSGSWSRHKHLSGDKALGIFYRNRRSQMFDVGECDEAERRFLDSRSGSSSLERSGSLSAPRSPTALRPRDSRSFSPIPSSPLVSKSMPLEPVCYLEL